MFIDLFSCSLVASLAIEGAGFVVLPCLFVLLALVSVSWHHIRGYDILEQWANRNDYKLIASEHRNFAKGPYSWTSSQGQAVYYVTVVDQAGKIRRGWVRCGNWIGGLLSNEATVEWDS